MSYMCNNFTKIAPISYLLSLISSTGGPVHLITMETPIFGRKGTTVAILMGNQGHGKMTHKNLDFASLIELSCRFSLSGATPPIQMWGGSFAGSSDVVQEVKINQN